MLTTLGPTNNNSELLVSCGLRRLLAVASEFPRAARNPGFLTFPGTVAVTPSLGLLTSSQRVICAEQRIKQEQETHFHRPPISVSPSKVHIAALGYARQHYFRTTDARCTTVHFYCLSSQYAFPKTKQEYGNLSFNIRML